MMGSIKGGIGWCWVLSKGFGALGSKKGVMGYINGSWALSGVMGFIKG